MNFRLKKYCFCWSRKLYSSLNVTLTYFLDQSMKLHILRRNQDFCCWYLLFDKWKQLRLMFCLLPFNTFDLELCLCHTNTVFLRTAEVWASWAPWLVPCRSTKSTLAQICPWRRKTFRPTRFSRQFISRKAGKGHPLSLRWM